jgi:hypothetical protein
MSMWMMTYRVEHDFRPYLSWLIEAESESEARLILCAQMGFQYEHTEARLA